jgi:hypothetical protein
MAPTISAATQAANHTQTIQATPVTVVTTVASDSERFRS